MKFYYVFLLVALSLSCRQNDQPSRTEKINSLAKDYVKLGLLIGQYDADFVDAYYGPDSLKPVSPKEAVFPKDKLLGMVNALKAKLKTIAKPGEPADTVTIRATWIDEQLTAFQRRIRLFAGEEKGFDVESADLFGVTAPMQEEAYFKALLVKFDSILPGKGNLNERYALLANQFIIPKDKLDTIFKVTIAAARKRTLEHYALPPGESFQLEYVTAKPWSGYNWYKGNYRSIIQINTDLPIFIDRAIDLACHEGYPGHHVYNVLLEKNLYRDKGWIEVSLYPLFSPQSLIAEGSANFGIEVAFPGDDQLLFIKDTLLPLAGIDSSGLDAYLKVNALKKELNFARNEVGRGLLAGTMVDSTAIRWLMDYGFNTKDAAVKSASFIRKYRSYVINYNYGQQLVKEYIHAKGGTENNISRRWELFEWLLSNEVTPKQLLQR